VVLADGPGDILEVGIAVDGVVGATVRTLESAGDKEPCHHTEGTKKHRRTTAPLVEVEDCRER